MNLIESNMSVLKQMTDKEVILIDSNFYRKEDKDLFPFNYEFLLYKIRDLTSF